MRDAAYRDAYVIHHTVTLREAWDYLTSGKEDETRYITHWSGPTTKFERQPDKLFTAVILPGAHQRTWVRFGKYWETEETFEEWSSRRRKDEWFMLGRHPPFKYISMDVVMDWLRTSVPGFEETEREAQAKELAEREEAAARLEKRRAVIRERLRKEEEKEAQDELRRQQEEAERERRWEAGREARQREKRFDQACEEYWDRLYERVRAGR